MNAKQQAYVDAYNEAMAPERLQDALARGMVPFWDELADIPEDVEVGPPCDRCGTGVPLVLADFTVYSDGRHGHAEYCVYWDCPSNAEGDVLGVNLGAQMAALDRLIAERERPN